MSSTQQSWNDPSSQQAQRPGQSSSAQMPVSSDPRTNIANVMSQLTEGERQALAALRGKVTIMRRVGVLAGAGSAFYLVHVRAKNKFGTIAKIGATFVGGIIGGAALMPLGLYWGQTDVKNKVEDQDHFKRVLSGARQTAAAATQHPTSQSPAGVGAGPGSYGAIPPQPNGSSGSRQAFPTQSPSSTSRSKSSQWGDDSFDDSVLYSSGADQMAQSPSPAQLPSAFNSSSTGAAAASSQTQSSRWAQLRNERSGAQTSSWDRIRQENAKQAYEQRRANPTQQQQQDTGSTAWTGASPGTGLNAGMGNMAYGAGGADPTFGKGVNAQRAQAQRDYEASFERERRGLDGKPSL